MKFHIVTESAFCVTLLYVQHTTNISHMLATFGHVLKKFIF